MDPLLFEDKFNKVCMYPNSYFNFKSRKKKYSEENVMRKDKNFAKRYEEPGKCELSLHNFFIKNLEDFKRYQSDYNLFDNFANECKFKSESKSNQKKISFKDIKENTSSVHIFDVGDDPLFFKIESRLKYLARKIKALEAIIDDTCQKTKPSPNKSKLVKLNCSCDASIQTKNLTSSSCTQTYNEVIKKISNYTCPVKQTVVKSVNVETSKIETSKSKSNKTTYISHTTTETITSIPRKNAKIFPTTNFTSDIFTSTDTSRASYFNLLSGYSRFNRHL